VQGVQKSPKNDFNFLFIDMSVQWAATLFKHYGNINIKKLIPVKVYNLKPTLKRRFFFRKHLVYHPTEAVDIPTFISILVIFLYIGTAALWDEKPKQATTNM
jgi:hypothetical protein